MSRSETKQGVKRVRWEDQFGPQPPSKKRKTARMSIGRPPPLCAAELKYRAKIEHILQYDPELDLYLCAWDGYTLEVRFGFFGFSAFVSHSLSCAKECSLQTLDDIKDSFAFTQWSTHPPEDNRRKVTLNFAQEEKGLYTPLTTDASLQDAIFAAIKRSIFIADKRHTVQLNDGREVELHVLRSPMKTAAAKNWWYQWDVV